MDPATKVLKRLMIPITLSTQLTSGKKKSDKDAFFFAKLFLWPRRFTFIVARSQINKNCV